MSITAKPVPEVGKVYHFFDDGKSSHYRHYMCKIEEVIPYADFKDMDLFDKWLDEKEKCPWLFEETTDYFIKGSCPKYDVNPLWFVRTKDGGWFSFATVFWWMSGRLDVDESQLNSILVWDPRYMNNIHSWETWSEDNNL